MRQEPAFNRVTLLLIWFVLLTSLPTIARSGRPKRLQSQLTGRAKYWIELRDKGVILRDFRPGHRAYEAARATLSERALERRARTMGRPIESVVSVEDLPIAPRYLRAMRKLGLEMQGESRWCNAVSAELTPAEIRRLRRLAFVRSITPVGHARLLSDARITPAPQRSASITGSPDLTHSVPPATLDTTGACGYNPIIYHYGYCQSQLTRVNVWPLHAMGLDGSGMLFGYLDDGFRWKQFPSLWSRHVVFECDYVMHDSVTANQAGDVPDEDVHGTATMSIGMAYQPDSIIGPAFNADVMLAKTEDVRSERNVEEDNYAAALEAMEARGVDVTTSSLGYFDFDSGQVSYTYPDMNGHTTICTRAAERAAKLGVLVVTAMGNSGTSPSYNKLSAPADADSIISVGALDVNEQVVNFSSLGPTYDQRIKPEICAPGVAVWHQDTTGGFAYGNGTSYATPLTSSCCVLLREAFPNASAYQIRRAVMQSGDNRQHPDSSLGWGRLNAYAAALEVGDILHLINVSVDTSVHLCAGMASKYHIKSAFVSYLGDSDLTIRTVPFHLVADSLIYSANIPLTGPSTHLHYQLTLIDSLGVKTLQPTGTWASIPVPPHMGVVGSHVAPVPVELTAYPNPASSSLQFSASAAGTWRLVDVEGRVVRSSDRMEPNGVIDTHDLPNGAYYLRLVTTLGEARTTRIVIQH